MLKVMHHYSSCWPPWCTVTMATASRLPSRADTKDDFKQPMTIGPKGKATRSNRHIGIFFFAPSPPFLTSFHFQLSRLRFAHLRHRDAEGERAEEQNSRCLIIRNSLSSSNEAFVRLFDCGETFKIRERAGYRIAGARREPWTWKRGFPHQ